MQIMETSLAPHIKVPNDILVKCKDKIVGIALSDCRTYVDNKDNMKQRCRFTINFTLKDHERLQLKISNDSISELELLS